MRSEVESPAAFGGCTSEELVPSVELIGEQLAEGCRHATARQGKLLRPRMVVEASRLGDADPAHVRAAAAAVELLHAASLVHDDVVDDSPTRRAEATVDRKYGATGASFVGVALFGAAAETVAPCGDAAVELLAGAACAACDGQMLETRDLWSTTRTPARYAEVAAGKTASVFVLAARLGGLVAGVGPDADRLLDRFGQHFGLAFQIADDVLDLVGDPARTGKATGEDVRHGIFTLPLILAAESDPELAALARAYEPDVEAIVARARATDGVTRALDAGLEHADRARAAAAELGSDGLGALVDAALRGLDASVAA